MNTTPRADAAQTVTWGGHPPTYYGSRPAGYFDGGYDDENMLIEMGCRDND